MDVYLPVMIKQQAKYALKWQRSATLPEIMVAAVAANTN